jgi:hypothetical protein
LASWSMTVVRRQFLDKDQGEWIEPVRVRNYVPVVTECRPVPDAAGEWNDRRVRMAALA